MTSSPFIEGTNIQTFWDSTSLGWLKECPRKYQYHMLDQWTAKGESVHLEFGILYHKALEDYDRMKATGVQHDDALRAVVFNLLQATWRDGKPWRASKELPIDDKTSLKCRENLVRTVVWYCDKFKDDPARTKIVEGKPLVELHFQFELGFNYDLTHPYSLCGYLDRVVEFQDQTFVMDRKTTTSTVGTYYFDQYDPDNQMTLYTLASQIAFRTPVKGVIVDAMQIAVGFSRPARAFIYKTPDQLEEWLKDFKIFVRQAEMYAEKNYWPMNDKSCHKYGGCTFRGICSKSPSVRDKFLESNFDKRVWNPLELRG